MFWRSYNSVVAASNEQQETPEPPVSPGTPGGPGAKVPDPLADETARLLRWVVQRSSRFSGVPFGEGFLRANPRVSSEGPPVARILRGGRGGEVRLKLYLSLALLAVSPPFDVSHIPARAWAQMLGLDDATTNGARRVNDAINWLADHQFVEAIRGRGSPGSIVVLHQSGSGEKYVRPGNRWVQVPLGFWEHGWIVHLSGSAIALLLILLDLQGGRHVPQSIKPSEAKDRYGLSPDTWTKGTKELSAFGLVAVGKAPQGEVWDFRRLQNSYWVFADRLGRPPGAEDEEGADPPDRRSPGRRRVRRVRTT